MAARISAVVDGVALPDEDARALWERFSAWMEDHRGDLGGFAEKEGFSSVHPGVDPAGPVLRASRSEKQRPYAPVSGPQEAPPKSGARDRAPTKRRR